MDNDTYFRLNQLYEQKRQQARFNWDVIARPNQRLPQRSFRVWLIMAGRGFGKTRTGSETVRQWKNRFPITNILGATVDSLRDIQVEGPSGILACCPENERPTYFPARRSLEWPNGARSLLFSAEEPERLRGKQHEKLWMDEIGAWKYPREAYDQAMLGLRLGTNPQAIVTTTPRPTPFIKELMSAPTTFLTKGTTYDNRANLAEGFFTEIISKYEGTRLGRQELLAEMLEDNPGALWHLSNIEANRVAVAPSDLERVVVGVDPAGTSNANSDRTGIVVAGMDGHGHFYVLADYSLKASPEAWARKAVEAFHTHRADRIIGEANFGGDMVEAVIRNADPNVSYSKVHASRGKVMRAEPIAALYEQNRVHHVGTFAELESQMTEWSPSEKSYSPDALDALVWALTELSDNGGYGWLDFFSSGAMQRTYDKLLAMPIVRDVFGRRVEVENPRSENENKSATFELEKKLRGLDKVPQLNPATRAAWEPAPAPPCPKCKSSSVRIGGGGNRCRQCAHLFDAPGQEPEVTFMSRYGPVVRRGP